MQDDQPAGREYPRPLFNLADTFRPGTSRTDAARSLLVRAGFLEALIEDPRTLPELQALAEAINAEWPSGAPWHRVGDAMGRVIGRWLPPFADTLRVPAAWLPWVMYDLIDAFLLHLMRAAPTLSPRVLAVDALAPPVVLDSKPATHETFGAVRERFWSELLGRLDELNEAERQVIETSGPIGKAPKGGGEHLRTWGRWVYATTVGEPRRSITDLAREQHATLAAETDRTSHRGSFDQCDCRKPVREAIAEATRLLNLNVTAGIAEDLHRQARGNKPLPRRP